MLLALYSLLAYFAAPGAFAVVLWRGIEDRSYWQDLRQRFGFGARISVANSIWIHAVSLGEVTASASYVRALRAAYPNDALVLTTGTPTGARRARELFRNLVDVRFAPYDLPGSVRRFMRRTRPRLTVVIETELWPNVFAQCRREGVPIIIASARISPRTFPRYLRFRALFAAMLSGEVWVAAQTSDDAQRFLALGAAAERVEVSGNLKFDIQVGDTVLQTGGDLRAHYLQSLPAWIAGSTHAGEEDEILDAHALVRAAVPRALLILVPRHPNRFDTVAHNLNRRGIKYARRSTSPTSIPPDTEVLLVDTLGELLTFYAAADVAFVGGSLVPIGGHNLLEPAALGVPVITGPHNTNSPEIARLLVDRKAAVTVRDAQELATAVSGWLAEEGDRIEAGERARGAVVENRGALKRLMSRAALLTA
jgi:3-deoxy-D-manno-octulosonic-acid transferase